MLNKSKSIIFIAALSLSINLQAREVSDVQVPDTIKLADQSLLLNGAGIRSKFVFDIYVGALYLPTKATTTQQVLSMAGPKRVLMHFLYDEVEKAKLIDGWNDGFEDNHTNEQFKALKPKLASFNALFTTVKRGDHIKLDYLPETGTRVMINDQLKGTVPGKEFYPALLKVWLGEEPADSDLKDAMLGQP